MSLIARRAGSFARLVHGIERRRGRARVALSCRAEKRLTSEETSTHPGFARVGLHGLDSDTGAVGLLRRRRLVLHRASTVLFSLLAQAASAAPGELSPEEEARE